VALALGVVLGTAIPAAFRAAVAQGVGGAGLVALVASLFPPRKPKEEDTDGPKTKSDILADDPQHSVDRLPDDLKAGLDAGTQSNADAQADAIFARHRKGSGGGNADQGGAPGGAAGG
jgi:hypothetical protein